MTGEKLKRDVRPFIVRYEGRTRKVDLPGWYPARKDGDGIHVGDDMEAADRALTELKAEVHGVLKPQEVRAIRLRLKLSPRKAGELLGGGSHALCRKPHRSRRARGASRQSGNSIKCESASSNVSIAAISLT